MEIKCFKVLLKNINRLLLMLFLTASFTGGSSQMMFSRNAQITFYSRAPIENIEAVNNEGASFLNTEKGEFAFIVLIRSFKFKKALMEEHFNENYLESNNYPKANFKGIITDLSAVDFSKDGKYTVVVTGDLTIHGVTKNIEAPGTISVLNGKISASSKFRLNVKEYNIKIPSTVIDNIAEVVDLSVNCNYEPYNKS